MRAMPNRTDLEGEVTGIQADDGGSGFQISLAVSTNASPSPDRDFVRAKAGDTVLLFCLEAPADVQVGDHVRVRAELLAGPGGGRVVMQEMEKR
jgi:hypothetical protein